MNKLLKKPSAWLPLILSLTALMLVVGYVSLFGVSQQPQEDEGMAARIFQILMAGQVPIIVYFALTSLPKKPKQALQILALQLIAALTAFAPVFFLEM